MSLTGGKLLKILNAILLSAVLILGVGSALAQDRDDHPNDNAGYNGQNGHNKAEYQKGYQDGINSGRADANDHKRADLENHPYYRNSHNQSYREGFSKGYHEAYGHDRDHDRDHDHDHDNDSH